MLHQNNESGHHAELHLHQQLLQRCGGLEGECLCKLAPRMQSADLDYSAFEESESVRMYCYELDTQDMEGMNFAALHIEFTSCLNREISRRGYSYQP